MAAQFVTLDEAKAHLRVTQLDPASEADLTGKLDAAEAVIFDYLKLVPGDPDLWPAGTNERLVRAAILIQLGELWRFRGDDPQGEAAPQTDGHLSPAVTNILRRVRDPALA